MGIPRPFAFCVFLLPLTFLLAHAGWAEEDPFPWKAAYLRGYTIVDDLNANAYEVRLLYRLTSQKKAGLDTWLNTTTAFLDDRIADAWLVSLGPDFVWTPSWLSRASLHLGISPALLTSRRFDKVSNRNTWDMGSLFQFHSRLGLGVQIMERLALNAELQHLSNAGLYRVNPGMNLFLLGATFKF